MASSEGQNFKASKAYIKKVLVFFDKYYSDAKCSLDFKNPFQLLAATILSAQCTDERVNQTTPALFAKYPTPKVMAIAELYDVENIVKSCGFFRNKAKNIIGMSQAIMSDHKGLVPQTLQELIKLPGVGRKTANVVLGNAFGIPGLTVDTHLGRVSRRLGLSSNQSPEKVESDLAVIIPSQKWTLFSHQAIAHGRALCQSRRPKCDFCPFSPCPRLEI